MFYGVYSWAQESHAQQVGQRSFEQGDRTVCEEHLPVSAIFADGATILLPTVSYGMELSRQARQGILFEER